ncbi:MAG TPA: ATP synthase F1 subunit delta [Bryobacterales bacterium]|nr:ATP synthase F1 subunit delta [Bryobacterales bacterium]
MARALANRYARALVDVVTGTAPVSSGIVPEEITGELRDFIAAFRSSTDLRNVLESPAVAPDKKKTIITEIGQSLGLSRVTRNFILTVAAHRRLPLLEEMLEGFETLLDERRGVVRADVAAARPVEAEQQSNLAARLGAVTGKQVRLHFSVDPSLLGGVLARIGSTVYDGSVKGQLHALGRRLAAE